MKDHIANDLQMLALKHVILNARSRAKEVAEFWNFYKELVIMDALFCKNKHHPAPVWFKM